MLNKYQVSLYRLLQSCPRYINANGIAIGNSYDDYKILKELVDKATPKKILKPVDDNGEPYLPRGYGECSKCKSLVKYSDKYCHECGQRLEG